MQLTTDAKPKQRLAGLCMLFAALRYDTDMHSSQRSQESSLYRTVETRAALAQLWQAAGQPAEALSYIRLTGAEPVLPSSFAVGTAAQVSIAASALAAAELWHLRGGRHQLVTVDMRHAAVEFRSERYLRVDGKAPAEMWDKIAGTYRCGGGHAANLIDRAYRRRTASTASRRAASARRRTRPRSHANHRGSGVRPYA